ncbi:MAG: hypothetical protein R2787_12890 [Saprospiraceae bacterium]
MSHSSITWIGSGGPGSLGHPGPRSCWVWIAEGVSWIFNPDAYIRQFHPSSFLVLLVIALLLIPFQASFEELFVRGYLRQGIGLGTRSEILAMVINQFPCSPAYI